MSIDFQQETKRLQGVIAAEKKTEKKIHSDLDAILKENSDAEAVLNADAYSASTGDEAAATRLESAETILSRNVQRVKSKEIALKVSREKIAEFEDQRSALLRKAKGQEYADETKVLLAVDAEELEKVFITLRQVTERIETRVKKMDRLATEGGFEPTHRNVLKNLRHAAAQRLGIGPAYMEKRFRDFYRSPIAEIFKRTMSDAARGEEAQAKTGT